MPIKNILPSKEYIVELFVDFGYINFLTNGGTTCENLSCLEDGTNKINTFNSSIAVFNLIQFAYQY